MKFKLGVIVNPYAGLGGSVGLKGSDGEAIRAEAFTRGASAQAVARMRRCLSILEEFASEITIYCFAGDMGQNAVPSVLPNVNIIGKAQGEVSSAQDTIAAVAALAEASVDIILFAGGDGTARNIADGLQAAAAPHQTVLGVPSGVKMHSGVYAITPEAAGEILLCLLKKQIIQIQDCDVRDIDEAAFREGRVRTRLYASMKAPILPQFLQQVKNSGAHQDEMVKLDIANYLIDQLDDEALYVVGPGSTTKIFLEQLSLQGSLLGVDIIKNKCLVASDVNAAQLNQLIDNHVGEVKLIITAIGGQGHILGRGNQQLTPEVLQKIGRDNIQVIATKDKIISLQGRPLLVDSNDPALDKSFSGYQSILVGYNEFILYPIGY